METKLREPHCPPWCCVDEPWSNEPWLGVDDGMHHFGLVLALPGVLGLRAQLEWLEDLRPVGHPEHFDEGPQFAVYDRWGTCLALPLVDAAAVLQELATAAERAIRS